MKKTKVTAEDIRAQMGAGIAFARDLNQRNFKPDDGYMLSELVGEYAQLDESGLPIPNTVQPRDVRVPPEMADLVQSMYIGEHPEGVDRGGLILFALGKQGEEATFNELEEEWEPA